MTQEDAFLHSIIEAPDDDLPRLAYADWLEEQGNPRGEFIHVQINLARLPAHDPRRMDLQQREQELLQRHAWEWAEPLGDRISEWMFERGFIERVSMTLEARGGLSELFQKTPIRHLRVVGRYHESHVLLDVLSQLSGLYGLEFQALASIGDDLLRQLLTSPCLRNLRTLILGDKGSDEWANEGTLIEGLSSPYLVKLEELAIYMDGYLVSLAAAVVQAIVQSPALKNLRRLALPFAELDLETATLLARSRKVPRLQELDLGGCRLPASVWNALVQMVQRRNLTYLRLSDADLLEEEGMYADSLEELPRYRQAFEDAVELVDWDSGGNAWAARRWKGFSWKSRRKA